MATAPVLDEKLQAATADRAGPVIVDLDAVSFMDSSGLQVVVAHTLARQNGAQVLADKGFRAGAVGCSRSAECSTICRSPAEPLVPGGSGQSCRVNPVGVGSPQAMSMRPAEILRLRLRCDASAPRLARRALERLDVITSVREEALLVTSELATNAVMHSGSEPSEEIELQG